MLYAAPHLPAGVITLIASLAPVVAVAIALKTRSEPVSRNRIAAIAVGLLASVVVLWPKLRLPGYGAFDWLLIAFIVPAMYGYQAVYIAARWPEGLDSIQVAAGEAAVAVLFTLPLHLLFGEWIAYDPAWPAAQTGIVVFALSGLLEAVLFFYLVQHAGGVLVSFGGFISLFAGILWGMVLFSERHGVEIWIAVALTCAALGLLAADKQASPGTEAS